MIAGGHQEGLCLAVLDKVGDELESLVVLEDFPNLCGGVVDVAGVVDPAALDHEEEALVAVLRGLFEGAQGRGGHLAQAGVDVAHVAAVNLKGDIVVGKEAELGERDLFAALEGVKARAVAGVGPAKLVLGLLDDVRVVESAAAVGAVGEEVAAATAEHDVDDAAEGTVADLLKGNVVVHGAGEDVAGEAGGCGVRDVGGDDEAGHEARTLGGLEDGAAGFVVGEDGDCAVVALFPAGEGGGAGGAVGDEGV